MRVRSSWNHWGFFKQASVAVVMASVSTVLLAQSTRAERTDDLHVTPSVGWSHEDHKLDLSTGLRYRWEYWNQRADEGTGFSALRWKVNGRYTWKEQLSVFAEGQLTSFAGLESNATGAAGLYRASAEGTSKTIVKLRQLYAEGRLEKMPFLRAGRQDINMGTVVKYPEANWKFLKIKRHLASPKLADQLAC